MKLDHKGIVPYLLAFIALVACVTFGQVNRRPGKAGRPPADALRQPDQGDKLKPPTATATGAEAEAAPKAAGSGRVVLITLDGWHVRLTDHMPVWKEMAAEGAWTFKALVPKGATTVISHAELYTGAEPSVNGVMRELENTGPDTHVHGWRFRWKPYMRVADDGTVTYTVKDTLFTAVETAGYKAIAVVQKGKLVGELRPDGSEGGIKVAGDTELVKTACAALKDDATRLVILHIGMPDGAGHEHGWLSDEYIATGAKVSKYLETIRGCIADADKAGGVPTTLIVTSDHGGTPVDACQAKRHKDKCGHGANDDDNRRVPWIAVGPGIKPGHQIAADIRLEDTAPTILRILGIPTSSIPTLTGVSVDEIFVRP
ncbi:MAG TPA: alkaline phosphatase family protein [Candidatus Baltobacteraceae bacterium]|nr:alkaline phosphatase family protein [Candidatus Baltobacteraceae bacterium]